MERLKGILGLAFSRKVTLAGLVALMIFLNRKLALGLSGEDMAISAAVMASVILGIAAEDAAAIVRGIGRFGAEKDGGPRADRRGTAE